DVAKSCGGPENFVKTETQPTLVNVLLGFITLVVYTPLEARVYCSQ
ncbi:Bor/Iss family lipoprotein, partial [Escherichia coli]